MRRIGKLIVLAHLMITIGCTAVSSRNDRSVIASGPHTSTPEPESTNFVVPPELLAATPGQLCGRLSEIETLPHKDPNDTDPIYEALMSKGKAAIPCLVEKISDTTRTPDPRQAPKWQHYAVGDTAVFILIDILREEDLEREKLLIEMLPRKYQEEWKTNGVYAYFNYVSEPKNRKELRDWWKTWLSENNR